MFLGERNLILHYWSFAWFARVDHPVLLATATKGVQFIHLRNPCFFTEMDQLRSMAPVPLVESLHSLSSD